MHTVKISLVGSHQAVHAVVAARHARGLAVGPRDRSPSRRFVDRTLYVYCGDQLDPERADSATRNAALDGLARLWASDAQLVVVPHSHAAAARIAGLLPSDVPVFDRARTVVLDVAGTRVAVTGIPRLPAIRSCFAAMLDASGWHQARAHIKVLCVHALVEGVAYGPSDAVLRWGDDVLCARQLPRDAAAVFAGQVERAQVLERDAGDRRLVAPVIYLGGTNRHRRASDCAELVVARGGRGGRALRLHLPAHDLVTTRAATTAARANQTTDSTHSWPTDARHGASRAADAGPSAWPSAARHWSDTTPRTVAATVEFEPRPLDLPSLVPRGLVRSGPRH